MSNISEDVSLMAFKAICSFVSDLSEEFGARHKPLRLYNRLVSHTQITHDQVIRRHLTIFQDFCRVNRDAILSRKVELVKNERLVYSERVYFDMKLIMGLADSETLPVIWSHLLTISALLDPEGKAKELLVSTGATSAGATGVGEEKSAGASAFSGGGDDFLSDIMSKIEKTVQPNATPMEAFGSIMQSGVFAELLSGLQSGVQSGKLDLSKMMGSVQGLVSKLGSEVGDNPEAKNALGMLSNMTTSVSNGQQPDMAGMMSMMAGMMGGMGVPTPGSQTAPGSQTGGKIEEVPSPKEKKP